MAMRLAFDLGLHVDGDPYVEQGVFTAQEGEARRSTFWSCVVVNQYVPALLLVHHLNLQPLGFQLGTSVQGRQRGSHRQKIASN